MNDKELFIKFAELFNMEFLADNGNYIEYQSQEYISNDGRAEPQPIVIWMKYDSKDNCILTNIGF